MEIIYIEDEWLDETDVVELYDNVSWKLYTKEPKKLMDGINNSLFHISAWNDNDLVGFIRVVGDGNTVVLIQDVLVKKSFQNNGIGKALVSRVLKKYNDIRQKFVITDYEDPKYVKYYEALGFSTIDKSQMVALTIVK